MNRRSVLKFLGLGSLFGLDSEAAAASAPAPAQRAAEFDDIKAVCRTETPEYAAWLEKQYQEMLRYKEVLRDREPDLFNELSAVSMPTVGEVAKHSLYGYPVYHLYRTMDIPDDLGPVEGSEDNAMYSAYTDIMALSRHIIQKSLPAGIPVRATAPRKCELRREARQAQLDARMPLWPFRVSTKKLILDNEELEKYTLAQAMIAVSTIGDVMREEIRAAMVRYRTELETCENLAAYRWMCPSMDVDFLHRKIALTVSVTGVAVVFDGNNKKYAYLHAEPWYTADASVLES